VVIVFLENSSHLKALSKCSKKSVRVFTVMGDVFWIAAGKFLLKNFSFSQCSCGYKFCNILSSREKPTDWTSRRCPADNQPRAQGRKADSQKLLFKPRQTVSL